MAGEGLNVPQDTNTTTKSCTTCSQTKALSEFYPISRSDPLGPRRGTCADCCRAYAASYKRNGPSLACKIRNELMKHGSNNPDALSPEVRAAVFPSKPIAPALFAAYQARRKAEEAKERKRERERAKREALRPMRWGTQETFA